MAGSELQRCGGWSAADNVPAEEIKIDTAEGERGSDGLDLPSVVTDSSTTRCGGEARAGRGVDQGNDGAAAGKSESPAHQVSGNTALIGIHQRTSRLGCDGKCAIGDRHGQRTPGGIDGVGHDRTSGNSGESHQADSGEEQRGWAEFHRVFFSRL